MRPKSVSLTGAGTLVLPVDSYVEGYLVTLDITGTATCTVSLTNKKVLAGETAAWFAISDLANKATDTYAFVPGGVTAFQLEISAGTGTVEMTVSCAKGEPV